MTGNLPTDVVANELAIRIFLFGLAAMAFFEAWKAEKHRAWLPWSAFAAFFALGVLFPFISGVIPGMAKTASKLVGNPTSWFGLFILAFMVGRPWWQKKKPTVKSVDRRDLNEKAIDGGSFEPPIDAAYVQKALAEALSVQTNASEIRTGDLDSLIEAKLDQFVDTKISAKFETHAQAHGRDVKLADLSDRTKAVEKKLDLLTTYTEQIRPILRDRFDNVDYGFAAIYNRERHQRLFSDLETSYENLAQPVHSGAGIANDATWQKQVKKWRVDLEQWLIIADYYAMGAKDRINKIHELMYDGEWTFNEAQLSANQVHRFKEASILWHNAKEEKPQIDKCLEYAAFHGPSKKGRDNAPPRPREEQ